ncbi:hypothetical protein MDAP_002550 [Mitosporidium daphniae]|uniref:Uncharacterized protein n=1 Tax=Mitosporidium daphniae TaxID=1485682 RepID=A0A098VMU5_9MICR|nr:uncharacterized protein DI09_86p30 [Mitosporidium daphniae]XP_013236910.1 uncharacterized protein DI09_6p70 [Mitosporidium daphniae]KGG50139.1 hypothetical protein DI09_86p30 [Mitosporidium daphniae]KGG50423.1 hypothetical protein DI09_6p70 [Mitosporidium daphniae]|eukprot:XP_013236579.1 uncharacterized protein DI09_86p30 [Mitosporidium daphniae]
MSSPTISFGSPTEREKTELSRYLKTECGPMLKDAISCVKQSHNQVKGIDCHQLIKAYLDCCSATPAACAERFGDPDHNPFHTEEEQ